MVNNAGTGHSTPVLQLAWSTWRQVIGTDLDGAFLCAQRAAEHMVAGGRGGRIINVTSVHEKGPRAGATADCVAKAGPGLLTKCPPPQLTRDGVNAHSLAPGGIAPPMTGKEERGG